MILIPIKIEWEIKEKREEEECLILVNSYKDHLKS
jgi:hypothetical protein